MNDNSCEVLLKRLW